MASGLFLLLSCLVEVLAAVKGAHETRCCPSGQVLTFDGTFYRCCKPAVETGTPELWGRSFDTPIKFPDCQDDGMLTSIHLTEGRNHLSPRDSCFGFLTSENEVAMEKEARENHNRLPLVQLYCSEDSGDKKRVSVLTIKRCCAGKEFFDLETRACRSSEEAKNLSLESLILGNERIRYNILHPVRENLTCDKDDEVLVEQEVDASDIRFTSDGKLQLQAEDSESFSFKDEKACLELGNSAEVLVARTCRSVKYCEENPCVRKCCPEGSLMYGNKRCRFISMNFTIAKWHEMIMDLSNNTENQTGTLKTSAYGVLVGVPLLEMWGLESIDVWNIGDNGEIVHVNMNRIYNYANSCIDLWTNESDAEPPKLRVYAPFGPDSEDPSYSVLVAFMWISCAFLFATLLVYINLPELQNLHGKTVMAQVGSLLMGYSFWIMLFHGTIVYGSNYCRFFGYSSYFFLLSAFLWLSLFCFDIWWTFGSISRSSQSKSASDRRRGEGKRFQIYCLVAWGLSFLLMIFALLLDELKFLPTYLQPRIGQGKCWFSELKDANGNKPYSEILFFIGPISLLLLANLIFYVLTARRCTAIKAKVAKARGKDDADANSRHVESDKTM